VGKKDSFNTIVFLGLLAAGGMVGLFVGLMASGKKNPKGKNALIVGDSLSAGFGVGWQDELAKKYQFTIKSNLSKVRATTQQMLSALNKYLNSNPRAPDIAFIYGGTNDNYSGISNETAYKNIQAMIDNLQSIGVKDIYVIAGYNPLLVTEPKKNPRYAPNIKTSYDFKRGLNKNTKGAIVIPIWDGATDKDAVDGIHISISAQKNFADYIGSKIFK